MNYVWQITLTGDSWYDEDEQLHEKVLGTRTYKGTEESAVTFARRNRVSALGAKFERVAVIDGDGKKMPFRSNEIFTFTIGM